jgi:hypothetical protein
MNHRLVSYTTKPDCAEENQRLVREVFRELRAMRPEGLSYLVLRLASGGFVHFVTSETEEGSRALTGLDAFRAFQGAIRERCIAPPQASPATVVGYYDSLDASPLAAADSAAAAT